MKNILHSTLCRAHLHYYTEKKNEVAEKVNIMQYINKVTYFDVGPYLIRKTILFKGLIV